MDYIPFYKKIWSDIKFSSLSPYAKLLFIYLFSNESVGLTGIYEIDLDVCKLKVKLNQFFEPSLQEILINKMIMYDSSNHIIFVVNRFKYLPTKSPKVTVGALNELKHLNHPFVDEFVKKYKETIGPYLYKLNDKTTAEEFNFLEREQLINLQKIYHEKHSMKRFLINRGYAECEVEEALRINLPHLK